MSDENYWIYQYTSAQSEVDHLKSKLEKFENFYKAVALIASKPNISLSNIHNIEKELDKINPHWKDDIDSRRL
jgi:hypothetical protein